MGSASSIPSAPALTKHEVYSALHACDVALLGSLHRALLPALVATGQDPHIVARRPEQSSDNSTGQPHRDLLSATSDSSSSDGAAGATEKAPLEDKAANKTIQTLILMLRSRACAAVPVISVSNPVSPDGERIDDANGKAKRAYGDQLEAVQSQAGQTTSTNNVLGEVRWVWSLLQSVFETKLLQLANVPPDVEQLMTHRNLRVGTEEHFRCGAAATAFVVRLIPFVHYCKLLKKRFRDVMALGGWYTGNLVALKQWQPLLIGCKRQMQKLAQELDDIFQIQNLGKSLGAYQPLLRVATQKGQNVVQPGENTPPVGSPLPTNSTSVRQTVLPPSCSPSCFGISEARDIDLECAYIHFIRMIALAFDSAFCASVNEALAGLLVSTDGGKEGHVSSGGIKGYERMYNKMLSPDDHFFEALPRPACNIDVVRCLATVATPENMLHVFKALQKRFAGFVKLKNGMKWTHKAASSRFHLRLVLATVEFALPACPTMGDLRQNTTVQNIWAQYIEKEAIPPSVSRNVWHRQVHIAKKWLENLHADTAITMPCEVQLLLHEYVEVRSSMHEIYKIIRCSTQNELDHDYQRYNLAKQAKSRRSKDGDSMLKQCSRDGQTEKLAKCIGELCWQHKSIKAESENLEFVCVDSAGVSYRKSTAMQDRYGQKSGPGVGDLVVAAGPIISNVDGTDWIPVKVAGEDLFLPVYRPQLPTEAVPRFFFRGGRDAKRVWQMVPALHVACAWVRPKVAEMILQHVNTEGIDAALYHACNGVPARWSFALDHPRLKIVQTLVTKKANVNSLHGSLGLSPSRAAAQNGHAHVLDFLLLNKADINHTAKDDTTLLYAAAAKNHEEVLKVLISRKAGINVVGRSGTTALYMAAQNSHIQALELLLSCPEVDVEFPERRFGVRPLYIAAQNRHIAAIAMLLKAKADINSPIINRQTPVFHCAQKNKLQVLRFLLAHKADIHLANNDGKTPLFEACARNSVDALRVLITHKASVDAATEQKVAPVHAAASEGNISALRVLLEHRARLDVIAAGSSTRGTPAEVAANSQHEDCLQLLLQVDQKCELVNAL